MKHSSEHAITQELKAIIRDWNLAAEDAGRVTVITYPTYVGHIRRLRTCWRNAIARYQAETGRAPDPEILADAPSGLMSAG